MASLVRSAGIAACFTYLYAQSTHAALFARTDKLESTGPTNFTSISSSFSWTNIKPTPELQYFSCYDDFQCARLELPLNWNATGPQDPTYNERYNMAIIRLPARVPVDDPRYGGPILINPGGPGDSGVNYAMSIAQVLQTVVDAAYFNGSADYVSQSPDAKYFDLIGFDPRGVGESTPFFTGCVSPAQLQSWNTEYLNEQLNWPNGRLDELWKAWSALAVDCSWDPKNNPNGSKILKYASTAMTARDIVEFVERHGEWREKQASSDTQAKQRLQWQKGEEPIQYMGFSYGTVLGTTLAAMQPHRVKRFLLDGVASSPEYYSGELTLDFADGDVAMERFFSFCAATGPNKCALWAGNASSDTRHRLRSIVFDLEQNGPIPGESRNGITNVVSVDDVRRILNSKLYHPLRDWTYAAEALAPLTHRDGTLMPNLKSGSLKQSDYLPAAFDQDDPNTAEGSTLDELMLGLINGGDSTLRFKTEEGFAHHTWASLRRATQWIGGSESTEYMVDTLWPITFDWRFGDKNVVGSNVTAHPVLFFSNLVDVATSLQSARQMTGMFKDSRLLIVDGDGHTTYKAPSLCAGKAWRNYFQTGEMPDTSKHCLPAMRPFGLRRQTEVHGHLTKEDHVLFEAQKSLAGVWWE